MAYIARLRGTETMSSDEASQRGAGIFVEVALRCSAVPGVLFDAIGDELVAGLQAVGVLRILRTEACEGAAQRRNVVAIYLPSARSGKSL